MQQNQVNNDNHLIYWINDIHGYLVSVNGRQIVLLLLKDISTKLEHVNTKDVASDTVTPLLIKFHKYLDESIQKNTDLILSQMIPAVTTPESYIPAELIIIALNRLEFPFTNNITLDIIQNQVIPTIINSEYRIAQSRPSIDYQMMNKINNINALSGVLNSLIFEATSYYQQRLFESEKVLEEYDNIDTTATIKNFIYRYCTPDANAYILNSELEAKISEVYPSITFVRNQGQLKEVMKSLGYEQNKINNRGEHRNKWAYFGIRKKW